MKFLLAAVNAKYIHSNLGVYSLKAYAAKYVAFPETEIEIGEYTINSQMDMILKDIYRRRPDVVGFSCYIWNIACVMDLVRDLPKVLPGVEIWLGGPEVSYDARQVLRREPSVAGIMIGEGEETFASLVACYGRDQGGTSREDFLEALGGIDGLAFRKADGEIVCRPLKKAVDLSTIPFPYEGLEGFENRIIYYESSRGCPFSCSYCLSSLDKSVRFRDLELVKRELDFFLERKVPQVKFVDRTFNCSKKHTMAVWRHIIGHDNGVTNFHFEISADLLDDEELELISRMRPGLIQLEIGVQSTNPDTIREIKRKTDLHRLEAVVGRIRSFGNVHQHLDLIAGLPWEDYESFRQSFNRVYAMRPGQLQLGFLKVLKGSYMADMAHTYETRYTGRPPYEVLATRWLDYGDVLRLKGVEEMVEVYLNSGQFQNTVKLLEREFPTPFDLFETLAVFYEENSLLERNHSRMARYEILDQFVMEKIGMAEGNGRDSQTWLNQFHDAMVYDLYLRENLKSRPPFAQDQEPYKAAVREFFTQEADNPRYLLSGYEGYEPRQLAHMAHLEVFSDGEAVLFDYKKRDALSYNAAAYKLPTGVIDSSGRQRDAGR